MKRAGGAHAAPGSRAEAMRFFSRLVVLLLLGGSLMLALVLCPCAGLHPGMENDVRRSVPNVALLLQRRVPGARGHELGTPSLPAWRLHLRGGAGAEENEDNEERREQQENADDDAPPAPPRQAEGRDNAAHGEYGWDIEDAAELDSARDEEELTPLTNTFITPTILHDLEAPVRRKAVRNPKGHYGYNRTADRLEQGRGDPVAI